MLLDYSWLLVGDAAPTAAPPALMGPFVNLESVHKTLVLPLKAGGLAF